MGAEFAESQRGTDFPEQRYHVQVFDPSLGIRIVFAPQADELVQMMRTQNTPVPGQVIEVVHNDGHEQVDDEERAQHIKGNEVGEGDAGTASVVVCVVRSGVALHNERPIAAIQHNVLPGLASRRTEKHQHGLRKRLEVVVPMDGRATVQGNLTEYLNVCRLWFCGVVGGGDRRQPIRL